MFFSRYENLDPERNGYGHDFETDMGRVMNSDTDRGSDTHMSENLVYHIRYMGSK